MKKQTTDKTADKLDNVKKSGAKKRVLKIESLTPSRTQPIQANN
jgi:hypothetical protein